jgi:hypothetical protein
MMKLHTFDTDGAVILKYFKTVALLSSSSFYFILVCSPLFMCITSDL